MADLHTYRKLPSDPCLSEEKITAYIDGKLSAAEQHACEKHMADCAMCEDAVEGLTLVKDRSLLAAPLKTESEPAEGKVVPLHQPKRNVWYAVAAVLVLVLGSTFLVKIISSDGAESSDMAYNTEAAMDSTVIAPGEGYATLENELRKSDCVINSTSDIGKDAPADKKPGYTVTVTDANNAGPMEKPMLAPTEDVEEEYVISERLLADEAMDGDIEQQVQPEQVVVATKDNSGQVDDLKEESEKKNNKLLDFATDVATGGAKKRAESVQKSKQDAYVDDKRNDGVPDAPAGNNSGVATQNTQTNAPQVTMAGNTVSSYDIAPTDSSNVVFSEVNTTIVQDSVAVSDQLELSYQNGLNLLNAGQTNNAIVMFDKVLTDKNHARYEDAEFQKAKALIKANKKEEAKTLLKAIEAKKGKHAAEATELLKTI